MYEFAAGVKLLVLAFGPPLVLGVWWFRSRRFPGAISYITITVVVCTLVFAAAFLAADSALERQFLELAPGGSWTAADEASWSPEEQRLVRAFFSDGGRNVFALFTPLVFGVYSSAVWATAGLANLALSRRRVA